MEKKGDFLATADAAQTQPNPSWFFAMWWGCTLQLFWTQRRIKGIEMALRVAHGLEPET